jgi:hypothetical protein
MNRKTVSVTLTSVAEPIKFVSAPATGPTSAWWVPSIEMFSFHYFLERIGTDLGHLLDPVPDQL